MVKIIASIVVYVLLLIVYNYVDNTREESPILKLIVKILVGIHPSVIIITVGGVLTDKFAAPFIQYEILYGLYQLLGFVIYMLIAIFVAIYFLKKLFRND